VSGWARVIDQPAAVTALRSALRADELAHAWLVVGPQGVGQVELTQALAMALNCEQPVAPDDGCGRCETCTRITRGTHSVMEDLEPEGATHVVDSVRTDWIPMAMRSLTEGRRRVLRVVAADRMNEAAQNAFLKVLEEPPPSVVWVLDAEDEGALLDTVVSRCRRLDLVPWGPEALRTRATRLGVAPERVEALARAAMGSPQRLEALADEDVAAARDRHLGVLDELATAGPGRVVPLAKDLDRWARSRVAPVKEANTARLTELEDAFGVDRGKGWPPGVKTRLTKRFARLERQAHRQALDLLLDDLASYLRDVLAVQAGTDASGLVNADHEAELRRDALRLPSVDVVAGLAAVARCRDALDRNGNAELQLERLLMALALPLYRVSA
jgi:DNA polymerase III subunit delta'